MLEGGFVQSVPLEIFGLWNQLNAPHPTQNKNISMHLIKFSYCRHHIFSLKIESSPISLPEVIHYIVY